MTVKRRKLGQTDLQISPIGLGTWQLAGADKSSTGIPGWWQDSSHETQTEIIKHAVAGGINWFDSAESYGKGKSEMRLAKALAAAQVAPEQVSVATKWWPVMRTAGHLKHSIDERLSHLDDYGIGLYQIHWPWSLSTLRSEMRAMAELVQQGKIKAVGLSNYSPRMLRKAQRILAEYDIPLASIQVRYSLLDRSIESNGILDVAQELGLTVIAWSPLEQGILTGKFHKDPSSRPQQNKAQSYLYAFDDKRFAAAAPIVALLEQMAEKYQSSPAEIALNWTINRNGETVVAIPGASKPYQVQSHVNTMGFCLEQADIEELDRVSA